MKMPPFWLLSLLTITPSSSSVDGQSLLAADSCGKIVCYHTNWSQYRPGTGKFLPQNIDPTLCTHLIYAFATITGNHLAPFEWNDDSTDWSVGNYEKFNNLKQRNPNVKTLLAVGGWNLGSAPFTRIVQSPSNRQDFITHGIKFLRDRGFDGLDLDWEYPSNRGSPPEDRDYFTTFVRELRQRFDQEAVNASRPRLLLTAAVGAGKGIIDSAYDVPAISRDLDFINLMSYDLHGAWETETGHNSPLYPTSDEVGDVRNLNTDFAAQYWVEKGVPKEKLNIGMGLYGRSFTLTSSSNYGLGAPTSRGGQPGAFTRESGFLSYYEVCDMKRAGGQVEFIDEQRVPFIHYNDQWVGFDSPDSLREKVRYVKRHQFGGVMVWALPLDDFSGSHCDHGPYPLMRAIVDECQLNTGSLHTAAPAQSTLRPPSITSSPPGQVQTATTPKPPSLPQGDVLDCQMYPDGLYASHRSCSEYFVCAEGYTYTFECASGLIFSAANTYCDWPQNTICAIENAQISFTSQPSLTTTPPAARSTIQIVTTTRENQKNTSRLVTNAQSTTSTERPSPTNQRPTIITRRTSIPTLRPENGIPITTRAPSGWDLNSFCTNKADGIHADPSDCAYFIQCSNGYTHRMLCAPGSIFNPAISVCDNPLSVPSCRDYSDGTADIRAPTDLVRDTFCMERQNGLYPDPADCADFIQCSNAYAYRHRCAPGTAFNPINRQCDHLHNIANCNHPIRP